MKRRAQWVLAALLTAAGAWAFWAMQQPAMVHQLTLLLPLC